MLKHTMRALMSALTAWVRDDAPPPAGATPHVADGSLVPPDRVRFPEIPANRYGGVERPAVSPLRTYDTLHVLDFGPLYLGSDSSGVITREPPLVGSGSYGVLEMQVDADGNDLRELQPDVRITRIRLSDKTSRLRPRHGRLGIAAKAVESHCDLQAARRADSRRPWPLSRGAADRPTTTAAAASSWRRAFSGP